MRVTSYDMIILGRTETKFFLSLLIFIIRGDGDADETKKTLSASRMPEPNRRQILLAALSPLPKGISYQARIHKQVAKTLQALLKSSPLMYRVQTTRQAHPCNGC